MITKILLLVVTLMLSTMLLGISVKSILRDEKFELINTIIIGMLSMSFIFSAASIIFKMIDGTLYQLSITYMVVVLLMIAISAKNCVHVIRTKLGNVMNIRKWELLAFIAVIIVIGQIAMSIMIQSSVSYDNNTTISAAMELYSRNSVTLDVNPLTGQELEGTVHYGAVGLITLWIATISKFVSITPTIIAYILMPTVIILMMYMSYYLLSTVLCDNRKHSYWFIIMASLIMLYSAYGNNVIHSMSTVLFVTAWDDAVIVATIFIPLVWYFASNAIDGELSHRQIIDHWIYTFLTIVVTAFVSAIGSILLMSMFLCIILYYMGKKKNVLLIIQGILLCVPSILSIIIRASINADAGLVHTGISLEEYWNKLKLIYVLDLKGTILMIISLLSYIYIVYQKKDKSIDILKYIPVIVTVVAVINPLNYYLIRLVAISDMYYMIQWILPLHIIVAYSCSSAIVSSNTTKNKVIIAGSIIVSMMIFGKRFASDFAWSRMTNINKIPEQTMEVSDIIMGNESDNNNVILPEELTSSMRLYNSDIVLFYYLDNTYEYDGNKEVYIALNNEKPNMQALANSAKSTGYSYIVFKKGTVDENWASVLYNMWCIGRTDEYEVFRVYY